MVTLGTKASDRFRACLHWGGGPDVGEVTLSGGGVTRLSIQCLILIWSRLHDRWGDLPQVTSPIGGPPPPCKQALREVAVVERFKQESLYRLSAEKSGPCREIVISRGSTVHNKWSTQLYQQFTFDRPTVNYM